MSSTRWLRTSQSVALGAAIPAVTARCPNNSPPLPKAFFLCFSSGQVESAVVWPPLLLVILPLACSCRGRFLITTGDDPRAKPFGAGLAAAEVGWPHVGWARHRPNEEYIPYGSRVNAERRWLLLRFWVTSCAAIGAARWSCCSRSWLHRSRDGMMRRALASFSSPLSVCWRLSTNANLAELFHRWCRLKRCLCDCCRVAAAAICILAAAEGVWIVACSEWFSFAVITRCTVALQQSRKLGAVDHVGENTKVGVMS